MRRLYITGICGLLGSNIVKELSGMYDICGVDLSEEKIQGCQQECFDIRDSGKLQESICNFQPDILIHTAAAINVDQCEVDRKFAYCLNVEVTKDIVRCCRENRIKLIYISTDAVYDGTKNDLYYEEDVTKPVNYYGKTKLLAEDEVRTLPGSLILRTNIYGINIQKKQSFGEWVADSLIEGKDLKMFTDISFSPILVNELAEIIHLCIQRKLYGVYHACGTGSISKYDFGLAMKRIMQIETGSIMGTTSETMNFKAKRAKNMGMSNEMIKSKLGIDIRTPEESIQQFKILYEESKQGK